MEFRVCHDLNTIQDLLGGLKKIIQFVVVLQIFMHGRPISEYELLKGLFLLLRVKISPSNHWLDNSCGWQIVEAMQDMVSCKAMFVIS
jgi:hypothetical protein